MRPGRVILSTLKAAAWLTRAEDGREVFTDCKCQNGYIFIARYLVISSWWRYFLLLTSYFLLTSHFSASHRSLENCSTADSDSCEILEIHFFKNFAHLRNIFCGTWDLHKKVSFLEIVWICIYLLCNYSKVLQSAVNF